MLIYAVIVTAAALIFGGMLWLVERSYEVLEEQAGILMDENESIRAELKATDAELAEANENIDELIAEFALAVVAIGYTAEVSDEGHIVLVPQPKKKRGRK